MNPKCFLAAIAVAAFSSGAGAAKDAAETEWPRLQTLLRDCTRVVTNPLPAAESRFLPAAPLLGNGEVGIVVGADDKRLSFSIGRTDFRRRAIGGVDILLDSADAAPLNARLAQDIERAEIRSSLAFGQSPLEVTSWMVPDQPLLICKLRNPSGQPLNLRVSTWTRPPLNMTNPFRLLDMSIKDVRDGLWDDQAKVAYGQATVDRADLWRCVQVGDSRRLKNEATGRYLALLPNGAVATHEKPDAQTEIAIDDKAWHGAATISSHGLYLSLQRDGVSKDLPWWECGTNYAVSADMKRGYGTGLEYAAHLYFPATAGNDGGTCWAWRGYSGHGLQVHAAVVTRVLDAPVTIENATASFTLPANGAVTLAVAVIGDCKGVKDVKSLEQCRADGQSLVVSLTPQRVETLSARRVSEWKAYWLKAWLDTGDPLLNRYWFGSMYLLKCANRAGCQSPALYGVWNTSDNPVCINAEFNNYNYQSQHYGTFTANRAELATPQFDDILKELPAAQRRAAAAGYPGAMWPRIVDAHPNGPAPTQFLQPKIAPQKNRQRLGNDQLDAPAFLAMNFLYAYDSSLDRDFLEKKAYPMVRACMEFYADYLHLNQAKNRYELHWSAAREASGDERNAAYPLAMIKRLASAAADYSQTLGVDADKRAKWRDIAARMSDYPTADAGGKLVFKESENRPRIALFGPGDNVSLLQLIHPGAGIGLDSDPRLLETARNTIAWFNSNPAKTSWLQKANNLPQIFTDAATVGWDAADLYKWFHRYLQEEERPNLTYQPWGVEGAGATEALHRMMLQSHEGVLRFFPVWPRDKNAQFTRLRAKGAFLVSAELKNAQVQAVRILSEKGRDCNVLNPWTGKRQTFKTKPGAVIELRAE